MDNREDVRSRCKGWLLRNSGRNSGVRALGTDSGCMGRTGHSEGASDACVFR